jgi:hypothetical protein
MGSCAGNPGNKTQAQLQWSQVKGTHMRAKPEGEGWVWSAALPEAGAAGRKSPEEQMHVQPSKDTNFKAQAVAVSSSLRSQCKTQNMRAGLTTHAGQAHQPKAFALSSLCEKNQAGSTAGADSCYTKLLQCSRGVSNQAAAR